MRIARAWWPALVVLVFGLWATAPLWLTTDRIFAGKFSTDNAVSAWFYSFVAHAVRHGGDLDYLSDFNWPHPHPRSVEFPNITDALLVAPFSWVFPWPHRWGVIQATAVLINGFGAAWLARALGCRGVGIVLAGCLGLLCRPVWKDLVMARMNAVWPGLALAALAASVQLVDFARPAQRQLWLRRLPLVAVAGVLGALSATVYPPYLLLLAPAGGVFLLSRWREARWQGAALLGLAIALGLILAWPELSRIFASREGMAECSQLGCPSIYSRLVGSDLFRWQPEPTQGLSLPAVAIGSWLLAPLALLDRRRLSLGLVLLLVGAWAFLSLGPCPLVEAERLFDWQSWPVLSSVLPEVWCLAFPINDFGRFATIGVCLAGVLGGIGLEVLGRWAGLPGRIGAAVLAALVVGQVQYTVISESLSPEKWHRVPAPPTATFLANAEPGPVVELPFDRSGQFLSAITAPGVPHINPMRPEDPPPSGDPFITWLYAIARGDLSRSAPGPGLIARSGLRWVLFDPTRCTGRPDLRLACQRDLRLALLAGLGSPSAELEGGGLAWDLRASAQASSP